MADESLTLYNLLAHTADGAFVVGPDERIVFWNQAAQRLLGYSAAEAVGRRCHEILGGQDGQGRRLCHAGCPVLAAARTGHLVPGFDLFVRDRSDRGLWVNLSILTLPAQDESSAPLVVHLFRNAGQKKQHEAFAREVLAALQHLHGPDLNIDWLTVLADSGAAALTEREREVLSLIAQGRGTAEIAQGLSISTSTVRNHVQNILQKLHVHSRLEALAYAREHGLIAHE